VKIVVTLFAPKVYKFLYLQSQTYKAHKKLNKMNARQAIEQNEIMTSQLLDAAKEMATRLNISLVEAIDLRVSKLVKYAKTSNEAVAWGIRGEDAKKMIESTSFTYDIHFNNDENSNNMGFAKSFTECEQFIAQHNGTNHSYFADYKGGVVSILCNETGEEIKSVTIK